MGSAADSSASVHTMTQSTLTTTCRKLGACGCSKVSIDSVRLTPVCTQWGYFMPAPPAGWPSIISRKITLEHTSKVCKQAYPPGKHFAVPEVPDVEEVNSRGSYAIEAHRLAFIDGDRDPWRPAVSVSCCPALMIDASSRHRTEAQVVR